MVFKRQEQDVVLARFFIGGDSGKAIRFIKRRGKFYRVDDIHRYIPERLTIDTIVEVTPIEILQKIREALEATLNGDNETYEVWVNHYIHEDLGLNKSFTSNIAYLKGVYEADGFSVNLERYIRETENKIFVIWGKIK